MDKNGVGLENTKRFNRKKEFNWALKNNTALFHGCALPYSRPYARALFVSYRHNFLVSNRVFVCMYVYVFVRGGV